MRITVKPAHYMVHAYFSRCGIIDSLVPHLHFFNPKVARCALKLLGNPKDKYNSCVFDHLHPICSPEERQLLRASVSAAYRERTVRPSLTFTVEPTLTIGSLKSLLRTLPWISENFLLVQNQERPLVDNSSTLIECGVEDRNLLLACNGGGFPLLVKDISYGREYLIRISSCFETVGELKEKIYQNTGFPPQDQILTFQNKPVTVSNKKETCLVAFGIVRDVPDESRMIKLRDCNEFPSLVPEKVQRL